MNYKTMRIAFVIFFLTLLTLFAIVTWPFYKAAFLAFTLAIIFSPLYYLFHEKLRLPRYIASVISTILVGICVILPLVIFGGVIATQIGNFIHEFGQQIEKGALSETMGSIVNIAHNAIEDLTGSAPSDEELTAAILEGLKTVGKKFYDFSPRMLSTSISIVVNFLLMLLFLVVFLAEGRGLYNWLMETSPLSSTHWKELAHEVRITITTSIVALFATAAVQGTLLGIGFWVAGFEKPYGWGLIAVILSLIPVIGAPSCYITASVVLFSTDSTKSAIMFLLFGFLVISTIDNLIRSLIVRGASKIHPVLVFVALVGAVRLWGPIGLLIGPVLLSIFLASIRIYRREFANLK